MNRYTSRRGFVMLSAALVLSALFLAVAIGTASRALFGLGIREEMSRGFRAEYMAEACLEEALFVFERSLESQDGHMLTFGDDSCEIIEVAGSGNAEHTITTEGIAGDHRYRLRAVLTTTGPRPVVSSKEQLTDL